jgi:nucleotide-binding universal stress UspA family protein
MERILIATDLTAGSSSAIGRGCRIAAQQEAELRFVHVSPLGPSDAERAVARRKVYEQVEGHVGAPMGAELDAAITIAAGAAPEAILEEARAFGADLIVLGAHGEPKFRDVIWGTTAALVMRHSPIPVLVAQKDDSVPYETVMAAVGGDEDDRLLETAFRIAPAKDVYVVHARSTPWRELIDSRDVMEDTRTEQEVQTLRVRRSLTAVGKSPSAARLHDIIEEGDVMEVIDRAWRRAEPDLLVLGTHGRGGLHRLLFGSYAESILLGYRSDLLVMRTGGAE